MMANRCDSSLQLDSSLFRFGSISDKFTSLSFGGETLDSLESAAQSLMGENFSFGDMFKGSSLESSFGSFLNTEDIIP